MPKKINSASRLNTLLTSVTAHPENTQTLEVWAKLFHVEGLTPNKKAAVVSERLNVMHHELELVREQMQEAGFSEDLYLPSVSRLENALSNILLPASWNNVRQYLTPETFLALSYCGEILPDEETQIDSEELSEIRTQVEVLLASLADSKLPRRLHKLIERHTKLILNALEEYPISGAKVLREVTRTALGEIIEIKEIITENRESPEISKLGKIWKKLNQVVDSAEKAEKIIQLTQKAWSMIDKVF